MVGNQVVPVEVTATATEQRSCLLIVSVVAVWGRELGHGGGQV